MPSHYLNTGQRLCYDEAGRIVPCPGSGQDAETRPGLPWPAPRFETRGPTVLDRLTGLVWTREANPAEFPLTWSEALDYASGLNERAYLGYDDWRLPNRRELRSLIGHQTRKPALPQDHPFQNVFVNWYWTSTSAAINPAFAWYVHFEGGRMFYGKKTQSYMLWPVRGTGSPVLPATGQITCHDEAGRIMPCPDSGQDGALRLGLPWPKPRFESRGFAVLDRLTGLLWDREAGLNGELVTWTRALETAAGLNRTAPAGEGSWRLPTINELESLVDAERFDPALTAGHPFISPGETYVSSTTSAFEPDWCMVLHLRKGAVGVGRKNAPHYLVWPVCG
ncbi:MAG: DUF1566 domain-containing protein [Proteobacteria bacterium]|nr:DUF1566 domain-containing protein [Pseudomonadota bacterium]